MKNEILLLTEWFQELKGEKEKIKLKMMLFIGAKADNKSNICKCSKKDLREWLGQKSNSNNEKNVERLDQLQEEGYISYSKITSNSFSITVNTENKTKILGIQKQWLEEIRGANRDKGYKKIDETITTDWLQTFDLFANIHIGRIRGRTTQTDIASILNVSRTTVSGALKLLNLCNFDYINCKGIIDKERINFRTKNEEGVYIVYEQVYNRGTHIDYIDYRESAF